MLYLFIMDFFFTVMRIAQGTPCLQVSDLSQNAVPIFNPLFL